MIRRRKRSLARRPACGPSRDAQRGTGRAHAIARPVSWRGSPSAPACRSCSLAPADLGGARSRSCVTTVSTPLPSLITSRGCGAPSWMACRCSRHQMGRRASAADGLAVVTIWRGEGGHDFLITRDDLRRQGWHRVESFIALFWGYAADALAIFHDRSDRRACWRQRTTCWPPPSSGRIERSLREYVDQVRWRLSGDFSALSRPEPNQYFADDLVHVGSGRGLRGLRRLHRRHVARRRRASRRHGMPTTLLSLTLSRSRSCRRPWRRSRPSLAERVHLHRAATADRHGTAMFNATGLGSAPIVDRWRV